MDEGKNAKGVKRKRKGQEEAPPERQKKKKEEVLEHNLSEISGTGYDSEDEKSSDPTAEEEKAPKGQQDVDSNGQDSKPSRSERYGTRSLCCVKVTNSVSEVVHS